MDCEIPEVVVFLKESDYETFMDKCIAGDVSSLNKCPVENCELDHNNISNLLTYELAKSSTEVSEEVLLYISTKGNSFSNHECIKDDVKLSGAGNRLIEDKADSVACDDIADAYSSSKIVSERQIFTSEPMNNFSCSQYLDSSELRDEPKTDQVPVQDKTFFPSLCSLQDPSTEANLADTSFRSKEEYENNSNGFEAKASRGRTRHGSDSLLSMILKEKSKANAEVENIRENADNLSKGSIAESLSRQSTVGLPEHENSSFSAASLPSGLLAFSGSITYSDSISQRSNSTTSTRSFAFPVLATEWSDSPVRMAEADRRHLKKPRCWGMCFNCCRI